MLNEINARAAYYKRLNTHRKASVMLLVWALIFIFSYVALGTPLFWGLFVWAMWAWAVFFTWSVRSLMLQKYKPCTRVKNITGLLQIVLIIVATWPFLGDTWINLGWIVYHILVTLWPGLAFCGAVILFFNLIGALIKVKG